MTKEELQEEKPKIIAFAHRLKHTNKIEFFLSDLSKMMCPEGVEKIEKYERFPSLDMEGK